MSVVGLIILLAVIGVLLWLLNTKVPMDPTIKTIINVVVIFIVVVLLLQAFGIWDDLRSYKVPRV